MIQNFLSFVYLFIFRIYFADLLRDIAENLYEKLQELAQVDFSRFNVINHGDTWTNNFLFKHVDGTNTPCGLK